jgi:dipeptidyl-peptidase-4
MRTLSRSTSAIALVLSLMLLTGATVTASALTVAPVAAFAPPVSVATPARTSAAPVAGLRATAAAQGERNFTYAQAYGGPGADPVLGPTPQITGWADAGHYLEVRTEGGRRQVFAVSATDGSATVYRDFSAIQADLPAGFDVDQAAATNDDLSAFVFEDAGDLYHYDVGAERFRRLTATPAEERNPAFSPDGNWVAYTRDGNLYAYDLAGSVEHQYTRDGSDVVYNGWASWVYFEEILGRGSRYRAFWWSPDSTQIAFMRFDDTPVPEFPIYHADGQHGELEVQRYPKAGDPNPWVRMGVVPAAGGEVVWMDFEEKADHYIAWPSWSPDSRTLRVQWMNRGQDTLRFFDCDPATGEKVQVFEERQDSWVDWFNDVYYLEDGAGYIVMSDRSGWNHIYQYDNRHNARQITTGEWRVDDIEEIDEAGGWIYFTGRPEASWDAQLLRIRFDGTGLEQLTEGEGVHSVQVSPGGRYFIDSVSNIHAPTRITLHTDDGEILRRLGDARIAATDDYNWGTVGLFTIPSADGQYDLPAVWVLPPDLDRSKQYPVLISIYGGPNSGSVSNRWQSTQAHYWAQRGVITLVVDHRASGHFGKAGVSLMHRRLGYWEMTDYIAAAEWLGQQPFVDADKIAITGSSYGGYTTMMALTYGAEHFDYGQAGAAVTDWRLYDTVYTERYMDTPEENPEGYNFGAVLTHIGNYQGGLRITHGLIDDNVHAQNSIQVIDWLMENEKEFEMFLYPDSRHGVQASQRPHYLKGIHDWWMRTLLDGVDPLEGSSER